MERILKIYMCRKINLDLANNLIFNDPNCIIDNFYKNKKEAHEAAIQHLELHLFDIANHQGLSKNEIEDISNFEADLKKCVKYVEKGKFKKANNMYQEIFDSYIDGDPDRGIYVQVLEKEIC